MIAAGVSLFVLVALQQPAVLERDPRALPTAPEGRWSQWRPDDEIADELRTPLGEGMAAYVRRDYVRALERFYQLLELEPDYPPALYQAATSHFRLRRYGDCAVLLERFVRVVPHEIGATQALGHSHYSLGRYEEARAHYALVLAANADSVEALRGYALSHARLGEAEKALELLRQVVQMRPDHPDAHTWIAQLLYDTDQLEEALAAAETARDLAPFEPRPWFLLSRIHAERGEDDLARTAKEQFEQRSRLAQEIRSIEGVLLHDPANGAARRRLIVLRAQAGDAGSTRRELGLLLRASPGDVELRILALDAMVELGDGEGARIAALDLERHCADRPEAWRRLRDHYGSTGDRVRQVQAGERYLQLTGDREQD